MADQNDPKIWEVTADGKTVSDAKALLRDPKVRETFQKLSKANQRFRGRPGITFLRPIKSDT
jgi:hypothetical protein